MAKDYILEKRKFVIGGIAISIVLIYLIRLFVLQITTDDYKKNADSNAFLNKIQYPSRGAIYDRTNGIIKELTHDTLNSQNNFLCPSDWNTPTIFPMVRRYCPFHNLH